eukprot:1158012-Pelagomonas_calceolata.AAC.6
MAANMIFHERLYPPTLIPCALARGMCAEANCISIPGLGPDVQDSGRLCSAVMVPLTAAMERVHGEGLDGGCPVVFGRPTDQLSPHLDNVVLTRVCQCRIEELDIALFCGRSMESMAYLYAAGLPYLSPVHHPCTLAPARPVHRPASPLPCITQHPCITPASPLHHSAPLHPCITCL